MYSQEGSVQTSLSVVKVIESKDKDLPVGKFLLLILVLHQFIYLSFLCHCYYLFLIVINKRDDLL